MGGGVFQVGGSPHEGHQFWWGSFEKYRRMGGTPHAPPPLWETLLFIYTIYTISISFICVSQEEPILTASNQRMYEFYKS